MLESYSQSERTEIMSRYWRLIDVWSTRKDVQDRWMVRKAFYLAAEAHKDARRRSGEPYIYHPLEVATIAAGEIGLGRTSIICALLHDVVEDTSYTLEDIKTQFGEQVAQIIDGLTKIESTINNEDVVSKQAENFKKIIFTLSYDIRVILIKLADRLHNMRTLDSMPKEKQLKIASETSYLYAPMAYRLGLYAIKSELEDLSLKYINPAVYSTIHQKLNESRNRRNEVIAEYLAPIEKKLKKMRLKFRVLIKERSSYQIWQRMSDKGISFEEVYDTFVVRFIVNSDEDHEKMDCLRVYSTISDFYQPKANGFRDWISLPKANGYESLQATFMNKKGEWMDVQICSERMEEINEKGYAAYYKFKKSEQSESGLDEWLSKARELLSSNESSALDFVDNFKLNLFADEISVYTPKGKMISLPKGSTALDFAYYVHSDLGNQCVGAMVNHKIVQLDHVLKRGDRVEIISSEKQIPKEEWLEFLVTARAKTMLKEGIRDLRKLHREKGRERLMKMFEQLNLEYDKINKNKIIQFEKLKGGSVDLYYFVSVGKITTENLKEIFKDQLQGKLKKFFGFGLLKSSAKEELVPDINSKLIDSQSNNFKYTVSKCCNPLPGDDVVAFAFPNQPMHIHRVNCPTARVLMSQYGENIVKAKWNPKSDISFLAGLKITGIDANGFANSITDVIVNKLNLNIRSIRLESSKGKVEATITIYVPDEKSLKKLILELKNVKEIKKIIRLEHIDNG